MAGASFSFIYEFNTIFWLISILCFTLYGAFLPFNYIAAGFFTETYFVGMDKHEAQHLAGLYMSIPFFISAFSIPIYGIMIDKFGQRANLALASSICGLISFLLFYFTPPVFALILLGCTYSLFASIIWPSVSLVVKNSVVGLAYGVTTALQNFGLVIFPMIVASIYSNTNNYYSTLGFFIFMMIISIVFSILLMGDNNKMGSKSFNFKYFRYPK
jgi:MFS family permease